jgi:predicted acylesterase/phospholipase RssA
VSGGSLTNGYLAQALDLTSASAAEVEAVAGRLASQLARRGTLWAAPLTWAYLVALVVLAAVGLVGVWWLPGPRWLRVLLFVVGVLVVGAVAGLRGEVCGRAFAATLFSPAGRPTRLAEVHTAVEHVLCATELHAGEYVYFSGGFVRAYRFGRGVPGDLPLHVAVQASAALPGAFPPRWLGTARHQFSWPTADRPAWMALVDGGVYSNMADQWLLGERDRLDELIVVNASAGLSVRPVGRFRLPLPGEVLTLRRDIDVLYDNGTSLRRQWLVQGFNTAERAGRAGRGALVHIPQSPFDIPSDVVRRNEQGGSRPDRPARARGVLAALAAEDQARWEQIALADASIKTSLSRVGPERAAQLLRHGYLLAMANLHVLLNYPLVGVPPPAWFAGLVQPGGQAAA